MSQTLLLQQRVNLEHRLCAVCRRTRDSVRSTYFAIAETTPGSGPSSASQRWRLTPISLYTRPLRSAARANVMLSHIQGTVRDDRQAER